MAKSEIHPEMIKALEAYTGVIKKCCPGKAKEGSGDLAAWARRRNVGLSGVEDKDRAEAKKRRAKRKERRYKQYLRSRAKYIMGYKEWLRKKGWRWKRKTNED